jgi:hypothetical protein
MEDNQTSAKAFGPLALRIRHRISEIPATASGASERSKAISELQEMVALLRSKIPIQVPPVPLPPEAPIPPTEPLPPPRLRTVRNDETIEVKRRIDAIIAEKQDQLHATRFKRTRKRLDVEIASLRRQIEEEVMDISLRNLPAEESETYRAARAAQLDYKEAVERFRRDWKRYLKLTAEYRISLNTWKGRYSKGAEERRKYEIVVANIEREVESLKRWLALTIVPWHMLPPGARGSALLGHIGRKQRNNPKRLCDIERVNYALSLSPSEIIVGEEEFDGYYAFLFDDTKHVLLENPWEGNAAFVFFEEWKRLSRMTKQELFRHEQGRFCRVLHRTDSDWKKRIRRSLDDKRGLHW